jgi:hypothetical protein
MAHDYDRSDSRSAATAGPYGAKQRKAFFDAGLKASKAASELKTTLKELRSKAESLDSAFGLAGKEVKPISAAMSALTRSEKAHAECVKEFDAALDAINDSTLGKDKADDS